MTRSCWDSVNPHKMLTVSIMQCRINDDISFHSEKWFGVCIALLIHVIADVLTIWCWLQESSTNRGILVFLALFFLFCQWSVIIYKYFTLPGGTCRVSCSQKFERMSCELKIVRIQCTMYAVRNNFCWNMMWKEKRKNLAPLGLSHYEWGSLRIKQKKKAQCLNNRYHG